jgi:GTP-binding protein HflX
VTEPPAGSRPGAPGVQNGGGRAFIVVPRVQPAGDIVPQLEEAVGLVRALDLEVVAAEPVVLRRAVPATLLGAGKVAEIHERLEARPVELVVVDAALTPVQQRNLERRWTVKVIDRTGLILEIFGARASTREGVLQVELAALSYQRSRLVRSWTHLERQRGGFGFVGGPGESQIELDRRRIGERIAQLRRELEEVKRTRRLHRAARRRVPYAVTALVGYTNAGKSTLFNRLTGAAVAARDQLFATLDPTMRLVHLPSGADIILSDTVGFISKLPTTLVAAFRATLEEVVAADLILHIRDISHPQAEQQARDVLAVLAELGVMQAGEGEDHEVPIVEVWNKSDRLDEGRRQELAALVGRRDEDAVLVSSLHGDGIAQLLEVIDRRLRRRRRLVDVEVDHRDGALIAWIYAKGEVVERSDEPEGIHLRVALDPVARGQLASRLAGGQAGRH